MRHSQGIEVKLRRCDETECVTEFYNPNAGIPSRWFDTIGSALISEPPGQSFEIILILEKGFRMYTADYLSVEIQFEWMAKPQVWVIDFRNGNPDGEYKCSHVFRWTANASSEPGKSSFCFPKPNASAHFPALKDVWVDDGSAPPSTGCLVVGVNRVRIDFTGGTSTDAKPKELAPATAPSYHAKVPTVTDADWVNDLQSDNCIAFLGEFRNIDREQVNHDLVPAIGAIDEREAGYINDESDRESSDDGDDEDDAESESEYDEEQDDEYDDDGSETSEVSFRPSASAGSRPESRWQTQRRSQDRQGLVIIRVPKPRLMAITRKNSQTQGPNQAEKKNREDKYENLHSHDNLKIKQEVIVLSDDEEPVKRPLQAAEGRTTLNAKREPDRTEAIRSDAEIKRRRREKQKLQLQLQQIELQQQLLEYDDVEE